MFDWDDLRVFVAASRSGSFSEGGRVLGMDTATVSRRVARLEAGLKATLLVRSARGLKLTALGAQILEIGLNAEGCMEAAARTTKQDSVSGTVRISAAEGFGTAILAPALPDLCRRRPKLRIELAANPGFLSPSSREVDMAITLSPPRAKRLIVEPLTNYKLGLYSSANYLTVAGRPRQISDLKAMQIVGYVDDLVYAPELQYLDEIAPGLTPGLSSTSIQAQRAIIASGGGIGVLPCFLGEGLIHLLPDKITLERRFWLSTHRELHGLSRMRAVRHWLNNLVKSEKARLMPK
jgi:DNA-binding transcriptional LysR family regulator